MRKVRLHTSKRVTCRAKPSMAAPTPAAPKQLEDKAVWEGVEEALPEDIQNGTAEDVVKATRIIENEIKSLKNEVSRLNLEHKREKERIKENNEKIKLNKQLPYLVGNVVEVRLPPLSCSRAQAVSCWTSRRRTLTRTAPTPTLTHSGKARVASSRPPRVRYALSL